MLTRGVTKIQSYPHLYCFKAEASALNHHIRLKSAKSTSITGDYRGHKALNRDPLQTDHHSYQGGTHAIVSSAKLVLAVHDCHCLQRRPPESGAD